MKHLRPGTPTQTSQVNKESAGAGLPRDEGAERVVAHSEEVHFLMGTDTLMALETASLEDGDNVGRQLAKAINVYHYERESIRQRQQHFVVIEEGELETHRPILWPFLAHLHPSHDGNTS